MIHGKGSGEGLTRATPLADWTMSGRMRCRIMCEPVEGIRVCMKKDKSPAESHPLALQGRVYT